jgi:hypothetical protein
MDIHTQLVAASRRGEWVAQTHHRNIKE